MGVLGVVSRLLGAPYPAPNSNDSNVPPRLPGIILVGPPGCGKTYALKQLAKAADTPMFTLLGSTVTEETFGYPIPVDKVDLSRKQPIKVVDLAMPSVIREIYDCNQKNVVPILFIDEINTTNISAQSKLLDLIHSRMFNATVPLWMKVVAAANPPDVNGGTQLVEALINRFLIFEPPVEEFVDTWLSGNKYPLKYEGKVTKTMNIGKYVQDFLRIRKPLAQVAEVPQDKGVYENYPTVRTWQVVMDFVDYARNMDEARVITKAAVGGTAANEFINWVEKLNVPPIDQLTYEYILNQELSTVMVIISALADDIFERSNNKRSLQCKARDLINEIIKNKNKGDKNMQVRHLVIWALHKLWILPEVLQEFKDEASHFVVSKVNK